MKRGRKGTLRIRNAFVLAERPTDLPPTENHERTYARIYGDLVFLLWPEFVPVLVFRPRAHSFIFNSSSLSPPPLSLFYLLDNYSGDWMLLRTKAHEIASGPPEGQ